MITINLLPEEFRIQEKPAKKPLPLVQIGAGAVILLTILTVFNYFDYLGSKSKLKKVDAQWKVVQPQALILNQLEGEVENVLKPEKEFLRRFVTADRPLTWILEWLSAYLPDTAWLTQVRMENSADKNNLVVRGLCLPSRETSSIEYIELYLHKLKEKMPEAKLSLTTARQFKEDVEVTQFTAIFEWPAVGGRR